MAVRIRSQGIKELTAGPIERLTVGLAREVARVGAINSPKDTGKLSRSITHKSTRVFSTKVRAVVGTGTGYGLYPERGTGIYGPSGSPIRPKRAPFLVFKPKGLSHVIRTKSVRGQPGQHYMQKALISVIQKL